MPHRQAILLAVVAVQAVLEKTTMLMALDMEAMAVME
jgi:hypothetical protein